MVAGEKESSCVRWEIHRVFINLPQKPKKSREYALFRKNSTKIPLSSTKKSAGNTRFPANLQNSMEGLIRQADFLLFLNAKIPSAPRIKSVTDAGSGT